MVDSGVQTLVDKVTTQVIDPVMALIFAVGLLVFIFGIVEYVWYLSNDLKEKGRAKQHMLWGLIGMFVMSAAYSLVLIIKNTAVELLH